MSDDRCECDKLREKLEFAKVVSERRRKMRSEALDRARTARLERDAMAVTLRRAEAKIIELVAYGEKRYEQWQKAEAAKKAVARVGTQLRAQRNEAQERARVAEARLIEVLRELARDAKIRGDVGKESGVEAWDYLNLYADKLAKGDPLSFISDGSDDGEPPTPEEFKRVRHAVAAKRKEERPSCPRCYEDVEHEDDHLVGDRDVNAWFECPGDEGPRT